MSKRIWTVKQARRTGIWGTDIKRIGEEPVRVGRPMWQKVAVRTLVVIAAIVAFGYVVGIIGGRW